ncbi:sulfite exporter TauE/SafE family protein [Actinocorallia sp. A-T 12471]|uniref:sulfite exporter TauE/SafE family protein n=1 Tax=Actinocorallia sp. A-T 12471 TaxID=3089813 RepID=UPI0029CDB184|nr:sulfite exporter TauE/SafE family protein [Actinocorallia sp. A-T 12471]MDX6739140.1 sulfite exporter TauE/SafE family protein [Actinocorallia sp. A-T 12471]
MSLALALLGAAAVGVTLGLLGAGGSILAVPVLVLLAGQPVAVAIPTALVVVLLSAAGALAPRLRSGLVRWPVAAVFAVGGVPAAFAGARLGGALPERVLMPVFALLMAVVAVRMLRAAAPVGGACRTSAGRPDPRRCLPKALSAGAGTGALTGMFGVGGGFAIVPSLTLLLGLTAPEAAATSLVVIIVNATAALATHPGAHLDLPLVAAFAAVALTASLGTGRLSRRLPPDRVRRAFAWTVLALAPLMALTPG